MIILMLFIRRNLRLKKLDETYAPKWDNYLDHLEFDEDGKLFPNVNFPILSSNISTEDEYLLFRGSILVSKLLKQGYSSRKLHTTCT